MSWIQVMGGKKLDFLKPDFTGFNLADISIPLSRLGRYANQTVKHYSVAEHSVHVCRYLRRRGFPARVQQQGLFHDAPEAFIGDMVKPLKDMMPRFQAIEFNIWSGLCYHFEWDLLIHNEVKNADFRILENERLAVFDTPLDWGVNIWSLPGVYIEFWEPIRAQEEFEAEAFRLNKMLAEGL